jgi:hypothetical protein
VLTLLVVVDRESRDALADEEEGKEPEHDQAETVVAQEALHAHHLSVDEPWRAGRDVA